MHVPGRLGLLANLTIRADGPPVAARQVLARVDSEDDRTGLVELSMQWHGPEGSAAIEVNAFRRVTVPEPTKQSLAEYLDFEPVLADARIAVVGGSRGLGSAIVGACAMSGATVWAGYHRSADQVRRLRAEFGIDRVRPWPCDVTDPAHTAKAAARLQTEADVLDGLVLCATPPLWPTEPLPEAMTHLLNYLESAIRMVVSPLLCLNSLLRPNSGWITYISSSAVERPPRGWAHYTTGKVAAEHFCIELAQSASRPLLLLRPPRMRTDLTDSPTAKLNALPTEQVAARMVQWAAAPPPGTTLSRL
jgi:NAD(P)-dependent dehydrogenase (short-subunit alcohol dehydrogenase family)